MPSTSLVNWVPTSIGVAVVVGRQRRRRACRPQTSTGRTRRLTVSVTAADGGPCSRCRRSRGCGSTAVPVDRRRERVAPVLAAARGMPRAPPSVETSTPPTRPPPVSVAVPVIGHRRCRPGRCRRRRATSIVAVGGARVGRRGRGRRVRPAGCRAARPCRRRGSPSPAASRGSAWTPPRSWVPSSPHDHWTVPAPNTSAPLGRGAASANASRCPAP